MDIPSCITHEPASDYHAKAGEYLSSHRLADFRKSPLLYFKKQEGLIHDHDSAAYLEGRAAHSLILEGREEFDKNFTTDAKAPKNSRTGKAYTVSSDKFKEWAAAQTKEVISSTICNHIEAMNTSIRSHDIASSLLAEGIAEGVVRTKYCGVHCQIRMDWFNISLRALCDLKTTDDLDYFVSDSFKYCYPWQVAFYRSVLSTALGCKPKDIPSYFIAVEKKEPFRCGVWLIDNDLLEKCQTQNERAIRYLLECRQTGIWPTGYEDLRTMVAL